MDTRGWGRWDGLASHSTERAERVHEKHRPPVARVTERRDLVTGALAVFVRGCLPWTRNTYCVPVYKVMGATMLLRSGRWTVGAKHSWYRRFILE
jgi:hypothetical protein